MPQEMGIIVFLALVFAFALPLISAKTGKSVQELLFGRKRNKNRETAVEVQNSAGLQHNDGKKELLVFISETGKEAKKHGIQMIVPGTLYADGETTRYSTLLVGDFGIIGVYCLGFGGMIEAKESGDWIQQINGEKKTFRNPLYACRKWEQAGKTAIREAGLGEVAFSSMVVFTNKAVLLNSAPEHCFDTKAFFNAISGLKSTGSDVEERKLFIEQLTALTARTAKQAKTKERRK